MFKYLRLFKTKINFAGETSLNQLYVNKASCKRNLFYIFTLSCTK